jgi:hypothetical protein
MVIILATNDNHIINNSNLPLVMANIDPFVRIKNPPLFEDKIIMLAKMKNS